MSIVQHPPSTVQVLAWLVAHFVGLSLLFGWSVNRLVQFVLRRRRLLRHAAHCEEHARRMRAILDDAPNCPAESREIGESLIVQMNEQAESYRRDASFF